ncbi:MAG: type II toxin-antitoxin system Phd/YefM family antitoxin [Verrucomicrobiae bacterium]|nr:type II toxin-antitoxin system Phd/YefM family antitoxin [Verrucomicrobiae bacterium]
MPSTKILPGVFYLEPTELRAANRSLLTIFFEANVTIMSTITVSELKKKPAKQWFKSASKDDLIVTAKGEPVAVLLHIAAASMDSTRALVRSVRALQAQAVLQQAAVGNGTAEFSMSDIDAEITASRRARHRK